MGIEIDRDHFEPSEYVRFSKRLRDGLRALEILLARPGFGEGPASIGAELEVALIDEFSKPLPLNLEVLEETLDPRMTVELDRFNLECNLNYGPLSGTPFSALRREFEGAHQELSRASALHSGRIAMIGILPTVTAEDLSPDAMTDTARYRALAHALRNSRSAPFHLDIDGDDPIEMNFEGVTFEGAATSLQLHLRVAPGDFAPLFNAVQIATAPVLAVAGNSPMFLGHRLWAETRVALFKQAVDERDVYSKNDGRLPRVGFGDGWIESGAFELFRSAVEMFPPLLPVLDKEDPMEVLAAGEIPRLREIRLHQGTVWSWNRPVYDPADEGHLRIELRALPSGPCITDMLANTAFQVGLGYGLVRHIETLTERLDFEDAHRNFYRAAQFGPDADLIWPDGVAGVKAPGGHIRASELTLQLVDVARQGLRDQNVDAEDSDPLLDVIRERAANGQTGAVWQRRMLEHLQTQHDQQTALAMMVERYLELSTEGIPVHRWPIEGSPDEIQDERITGRTYENA
jgi:hypothetical protein